MKKKLLALSLVAAMAVGVFAGCSSSEEPAETTEGTEEGAEATGEKYIIATDTVFPPFEFTNEDGDFVGIDVDIINAIAEDQGIDVEIQSLGFDAALLAVQSGQADGVIAGMSITDERKQSFDFSEPYFDADVTMAVAKGSDVKSYEDLDVYKRQPPSCSVAPPRGSIPPPFFCSMLESISAASVPTFPSAPTVQPSGRGEPFLL